MDAGGRKVIVLAPLDPVHNVGLMMVRHALQTAGAETIILPPDTTPEVAVQLALDKKAEYLMVSRTIGYQAGEILSRLVDLADASGLRERAKLVVGGMGVKNELAAELGFDACFPAGSPMEAVVDYVFGLPHIVKASQKKGKRKLPARDYSYRARDPQLGGLLGQIAERATAWAMARTSPGIARAEARAIMLDLDAKGQAGCREFREAEEQYLKHCQPEVAEYYRTGKAFQKTRVLTQTELADYRVWIQRVKARTTSDVLQHHDGQPPVFVQVGTGCPLLDILNIKIAEAWGADGVLFINPAWAARTEGLIQGFIAHERDGSLTTIENIRTILEALEPHTLFTLRAHRGVNTAEETLLAGALGCDLTKLNPIYGAISGGTDPERLLVDVARAMRYAARYGLSYDIPGNDELSGVPAYKSLASLLISAHMGVVAGARPILKPLLCYSPDVVVKGHMRDDFITYNAAKLAVLRRLIDAPIWPGEPVGFMTHSEDRVQSAQTSALHAGLAAATDVEAITVASSDEAYARGAITAAARVDVLRAVKDNFRFNGRAWLVDNPGIQPVADRLEAGIREVLGRVAGEECLVDAVKKGVLGNEEEGAYLGKGGAGTVTLL